jgi:PIN domain nuclease of toxin-antitoxin system
MKALLDTRVFLWVLVEPERIAAKVRRALEDPAHTVFVSVVSGWEIEIKRALGKIQAPANLTGSVQALRFTELPLQFRHVRELARLPDRHGDPFDRMLIAQARADGLTLVTHDRDIIGYPVKTMPV